MKQAVHRETFIALRARREGHRIANEVLNPPLQVPPVPVPVAPREPQEVIYETVYAGINARYRNHRADAIAIVLGLLIPVIFMAILIYLTR